MRTTIETAYAAEPDRVVGIRLDPGFLGEVCRRNGALDFEVDAHAAPDGSGTSRVRRTMPTDDFPDAARRFVGKTIVFVEEVVWDAPAGAGRRSGTVRILAEGFPVTIAGAIDLAPAPAGSLERISGEITAKIPLVGGRIEKSIEPALREGVVVQAETLAEWAAR